MNKSKSLASSIFAPSISVVHLVNGAQFLNAAQAAMFPAIAILLLLKCKHDCSHFKDWISILLYYKYFCFLNHNLHLIDY